MSSANKLERALLELRAGQFLYKLECAGSMKTQGKTVNEVQEHIRGNKSLLADEFENLLAEKQAAERP